MRIASVVAVQVLCLLAIGTQSAWADAKEQKGEPQQIAIYDADPEHLWNRLHRAFFFRPDAAPEAQNPDAVDPPLWKNTSFLRSGKSHRTALSVLDEFLSNKGSDKISDPLKRAVLQHDLWSVFDWTATCYKKDEAQRQNLSELRTRLAKIIWQLALTEEEIDSLPNNLADAAAAKTFAAKFDPKKPRTPFVPNDLFDPDGSWVCIRGVFPGPVAPVHSQFYHVRSPFLVFVRLPGGREETLAYLAKLNRETKSWTGVEGEADLPNFPPGTAVALVRQMTVIDTSGEIRVTPLTQTLQMRVYVEVGKEVDDHENSQAPIKFRMARKDLFEKRNGGFNAIGWDEPVRVSIYQHGDVFHAEEPKGKALTVMDSCIACHSCGGATVDSIFTYLQQDWVPGAHQIPLNAIRLTPTNPDYESRTAVEQKMKRKDWGMLKGLIGEPVEAAEGGNAAGS